MIAISFFGIAKDTTAKNPPTQRKSPTNDFNAILTPVFQRIVLDNTSVFCIKFAVSAAYKSLRNGDTVIYFFNSNYNSHFLYCIFG